MFFYPLKNCEIDILFINGRTVPDDRMRLTVLCQAQEDV